MIGSVSSSRPSSAAYAVPARVFQFRFPTPFSTTWSSCRTALPSTIFSRIDSRYCSDVIVRIQPPPASLPPVIAQRSDSRISHPSAPSINPPNSGQSAARASVRPPRPSSPIASGPREAVKPPRSRPLRPEGRASPDVCLRQPLLPPWPLSAPTRVPVPAPSSKGARARRQATT